ncbi:N-formylglutamate amidohydrolase [candidate division KSB1 bacterium]
MYKLPILISVPHGGTLVPDELKDYVRLNKYELFNDSDAFTKDIYDLNTKVEIVITADIARAFIDFNRAKDDRPPKNPDGIVKTHTCFNIPIYKKNFIWNENLTHILINRYYKPYHKRIRKSIQRSKIKLALDCHSMAAVGPPISPDVGEKRKAMICLGNRNGESCDFEIVQKLADCFQNVFSLQKKEVKINKPFSGGYITQSYGMKPIPWIQVEMNRALYLTPPWFNYNTIKMDKKRLRELNQMFEKTLIMFFNEE